MRSTVLPAHDPYHSRISVSIRDRDFIPARVAPTHLLAPISDCVSSPVLPARSRDNDPQYWYSFNQSFQQL